MSIIRCRVKTYGEVFTPHHMVNEMLDLVRAELETGPQFVDKTFFEPAAGDGNFLVAILHRKLRAIKRRYQPEFWPTESLFALASIYGVELLADNHEAAKATLLAEFVRFHERNGVNCGYRTNLRRAATYLICVNILQGNTLTGLDATGQLIEFSGGTGSSTFPARSTGSPSPLIRCAARTKLLSISPSTPSSSRVALITFIKR